MIKVLTSGFCALSLLAAIGPASACTCRIFEAKCEKEGGGRAPCKQAENACTRTGTFVGPVTGRTWQADGTNRCG
jgi:hypothetical protein